MTNFEHYKEEILKIVNTNETRNSDAIVDMLDDKFSSDFEDENKRDSNQTLIRSFIIWGYSEYVEPYKLTKQEKWILENLSDKIEIIVKEGICVYVSNNRQIMGNIAWYFDVKFDCLKFEKFYKIADILANCEVID